MRYNALMTCSFAFTCVSLSGFSLARSADAQTMKDSAWIATVHRTAHNEKITERIELLEDTLNSDHAELARRRHTAVPAMLGENFWNVAQIRSGRLTTKELVSRIRRDKAEIARLKRQLE